MMRSVDVQLGESMESRFNSIKNSVGHAVMESLNDSVMASVVQWIPGESNGERRTLNMIECTRNAVLESLARQSR